ncbi:SMP-30/gluconolactonase/LRE family protein [candidate division KSB1 bacterium]|nr:SMP-30/gluconolactonase/LRE family protein [candidate division KSB1 bacterium]
MKTNRVYLIRQLQRIVYFVLLATVITTPPIVAKSPISKTKTIEKIATGFQFTEGPCWRKAGYLVFSDIQGNTIYKWTSEKGVEKFLQPSGNANGLAEDHEGRLLLAQHGKRSISRLEANGSESVLAMNFNGKRLNSPNDIAIKSDGSIYFTDPPYGITKSQEELGFYGVFRLNADGSNLVLLVDSLYRPNGLAFSPDESQLYVCDTDAKRVLVYQVETNGVLSNGKIFVTTGDGNPDGIKVDAVGNLFVACSDAGVQIYSPKGILIDQIMIPERTRNLSWGDADRKTLYVTAGISVYRVQFVTQESGPEMTVIPGGAFQMGDHHNLGGLEHGNDELPIHLVTLDSFYMGKFEITNAEFCKYLQSACTKGWIQVRDGYVYAMGGKEIFCETYPTVDYSQIYWDGAIFSVRNNREKHPMVGVRWFGAIAYCNWLSVEEGYQTCYDLSSGSCDFSKNGYRLPTEAEWEYAGRGGQYEPYYIFPWGDDKNTDGRLANWPESGDPYETGPYPWTTPIGFYNGELHQKADFNWPGAQQSYQTEDGSNTYGLYDMSGNVWEWIYDWYGRDYYKKSALHNPTGPVTGSPMPDGKPYRTLRSGNWYNGKEYWGHGRVSNRNPSYYRGPDDPNHAWYHIGLRVARNFTTAVTKIGHSEAVTPDNFNLQQNYPNPFNASTTIRYSLPESGLVTLTIFDLLGREIKVLEKQVQASGNHQITFDANELKSGVYLYQLNVDGQIKTRKAIYLK